MVDEIKIQVIVDDLTKIGESSVSMIIDETESDFTCSYFYYSGELL